MNQKLSSRQVSGHKYQWLQLCHLPVLSGILQGLVLGLLLFVSYLNDVATAISSDSNVSMFADDIAL